MQFEKIWEKVLTVLQANSLSNHHLQTVSVVTAAVRSLLDKDLITEDKGAYMVYDPFFALWLRRVGSEKYDSRDVPGVVAMENGKFL